MSNTGERVQRLIFDELVFDDPCAVDHTIEPTIVVIDGIDQVTEGSFIADINLVIAHVGACTLHRAQVVADLRS